jgi:hypothetical protein
VDAPPGIVAETIAEMRTVFPVELREESRMASLVGSWEDWSPGRYCRRPHRQRQLPLSSVDRYASAAP